MTQDIDTKNQLYTDNETTWVKVKDICKGTNLDKYLIKMNPLDTSDENVLRNKQYYERAVFYALAGYTVRGMIGIMFRKDPNLGVPPMLDYVEKNVDGAGVSIFQQSHQVCKEIIQVGRAGLWVDFPATDENISLRDLREGKVFSTIKEFEATQILNWSTVSEGSDIKLSQVVLTDTYETDQNEVKDLIIELSLAQGIYVYRQYVEDEDGSWVIKEEVTPTKGNGSTWDHIPFVFIGSEDNSPTVDLAPMHDIVRINIGHWNNSATYENSVWFAGQPQPWMSGLTEDYIKLLNENNMYVGSGRLLAVPSGETFGYAQAPPSTMAKEAMKDKVEMCIGLGAMFIQPGSAVKTATQSEGERETSHSILSLIAVNVSEAYAKALTYAAMFMNESPEDISYDINQEYVKPQATAQELQAIVASLLQGAMPFSDYVEWCKKHGFIEPTKTVEEVSEEVGWSGFVDREV